MVSINGGEGFDPPSWSPPGLHKTLRPMKKIDAQVREAEEERTDMFTVAQVACSWEVICFAQIWIMITYTNFQV